MTTKNDLDTAVLDAARRGQTIPCLTSSADDWFNDQKGPRTRCERACLDCPVFVICGAYADDAQEENGVWGGQYRGSATGNKHRAPDLTAEQKKQVDELSADGVTIEQTCERLGIERQSLKRYRREVPAANRQPWPPELLAEALRLNAAGHTPTSIARTIGRPATSVRRVLNEHASQVRSDAA